MVSSSVDGQLKFGNVYVMLTQGRNSMYQPGTISAVGQNCTLAHRRLLHASGPAELVLRIQGLAQAVEIEN